MQNIATLPRDECQKTCAQCAVFHIIYLYIGVIKVLNERFEFFKSLLFATELMLSHLVFKMSTLLISKKTNYTSVNDQLMCNQFFTNYTN